MVPAKILTHFSTQHSNTSNYMLSLQTKKAIALKKMHLRCCCTKHAETIFRQLLPRLFGSKFLDATKTSTRFLCLAIGETAIKLSGNWPSCLSSSGWQHDVVFCFIGLSLETSSFSYESQMSDFFCLSRFPTTSPTSSWPGWFIPSCSN